MSNLGLGTATSKTLTQNKSLPKLRASAPSR
jgi:hypothetical protein